ncbi:uncharacterized protein MEPE_04265 [Melanopsichium pennsylvanicum]|uniref:Uncharacterized protein n=1 Tax=Melanopsichium pennsylvanicum TaxID=63383 RepID=A0AAJ4XPI9_9BASI|nr:uncharacterized protein MEPE_04265 [Melanopsichium pennsylvanicum]
MATSSEILNLTLDSAAVTVFSVPKLSRADDRGKKTNPAELHSKVLLATLCADPHPESKSTLNLRPILCRQRSECDGAALFLIGCRAIFVARPHNVHVEKSHNMALSNAVDAVSSYREGVLMQNRTRSDQEREITCWLGTIGTLRSCQSPHAAGQMTSLPSSLASLLFFFEAATPMGPHETPSESNRPAWVLVEP